MNNTSPEHDLPNIQDLKESFIKLYKIISHLRGPGGCSWDREQSPYTIRKNLLEETYECINAIEQDNQQNFKEELGDLYMILTMLSRMSEERNTFTLKQVFDDICTKLIRRHPHVFAKKKNKKVKDIIEHWDYIKEHIEGKKPEKTILQGINKNLPPLEKAYQIQKKVSKVGFDWKTPNKVWKKINEEISEIKTAYKKKDDNELEMEIGDLLFTIVNLARLMNINPGLALQRANHKFIKRFKKVEARVKAMNINLKEAGLSLLDSIWNSIKHSPP